MMLLIDYMRENELSDASMAQQIGDCTPLQVRKWKYREANPTPS